MFKGITRGLSAFMAPTEFEKVTDIYSQFPSQRTTYSVGYEQPRTEIPTLQVKWISCLADNDPETRPSMAFSTIIAKLQTSDSRHEWNYILKNLVLLDRCVEEGLFLYDVVELDLDFVKNFTDKNPKNNAEGLDELVRKYYFYILAKAKLYTRPNSVRINRAQKKDYFNSLSIDDIALEIRLLNKIITFITEIAESGSKGYLKYKLTRYVYLLMLDTTMKCFASVYLGIIHMLDKVFEAPLEVARDCFNVYQEYLRITEMITVFTRNHQFIKGFQGVSISDFVNAKRDSEILSNINTYIQILEEKEALKDKIPTHCQAIEIERRLSELIDRKISLHFDPPPQKLNLEEVVNPAVTGKFNPEHIPIPMTESVVVGKNEVANRFSNLLTKDGTPFHISKTASLANSRPQSLTPMILTNNASVRSNSSNETFEEKKKHYFAPSFEIFINLNEEDAMFSNWNNFYNESYSKWYLNQMTWDLPVVTHSQTYTMPTDPIAFVEENPRSIKLGAAAFEEVESPSDDVYDNYNNFYSKNYDAKKGARFNIVKQASNFISFLTK